MLNKNTCFTLRMFRIFINCLLKLVILLLDFSGCEGRQKGTTVRTSIIFPYSVWSGFAHILTSSTLLMWIRSCVKETRFYSVKFYYEAITCIESILISKKNMISLMWAFLFLVWKHILFTFELPNFPICFWWP